MKKKIALILAFVFAMSLLAGCGDKGKSIREIDVEKYVTLGDYKSITASVVMSEVTEGMVDQSVDGVWQGLLTEETGIKDRAVADGDQTFITFVGTKDGVEFEGGSGDSFLKIGSHSFIPGFEEGLVGVMPGDTVDLNLTFPEDYHSPDLAGAEVVFTVTVHYIGAEMTDENVKLLSDGQYENVDAIRNAVKEYMNSYLSYSYRSQLENEVLTQMVNMCTYKEFPDWLTKQYAENMRESLENTAASSGVDVDTYCTNSFGMTADEYVDTFSGEAVKQGLVFQAIANREDLNVDDEELNASLESYIQGTEFETIEEFVGDKDIEEYREYFMFEKVLAYLCDLAVENANK